MNIKAELFDYINNTSGRFIAFLYVFTDNYIVCHYLPLTFHAQSFDSMARIITAKRKPTIPTARIPTIIWVVEFESCPFMIIQPTPCEDLTISAATTVAQDDPIAICRPANI